MPNRSARAHARELAHYEEAVDGDVEEEGRKGVARVVVLPHADLHLYIYIYIYIYIIALYFVTGYIYIYNSIILRDWVT